MSEKKHSKGTIQYIVVSLVFLVGIIMSSVGGAMLLSSGAKLVFFKEDPYRWDYEEMCRFQVDEFNGVKLKGNHEIETLPAKREKGSDDRKLKLCVEKKREEARERFRAQKLQSIIDGGSSLIVGLILVFSFLPFFRKRGHSS